MEACFARADDADKKIATIQATVVEITDLMSKTALKAGAAGGGKGGGEGLQKFQKDMLEQLRVLRSTIEEERGPMAALQKERDEAVAERALLQEQGDKQAIRIVHLLRAIDPNAAPPPVAASSSQAAAAADASIRKGSCLTPSGFI
ncbi:hypothetical protein T484DRAFT_1977786 [Baffinella frigidus]|nr:hypothetical protein T484DRAFT_1977786 [Cryptophyta sp. CCMP2293]